MSILMIVLAVMILATLLGSPEIGALCLIMGVLGNLAYVAWPN